MSEKKLTCTKADLDEFEKLIDGVSSFDQLVRIDSRMKMRKFVAHHGKEKCDAMFAHLEGGVK